MKKFNRGSLFILIFIWNFPLMASIIHCSIKEKSESFPHFFSKEIDSQRPRTYLEEIIESPDWGNFQWLVFSVGISSNNNIKEMFTSFGSSCGYAFYEDDWNEINAPNSILSKEIQLMCFSSVHKKEFFVELNCHITENNLP